MLKTQMVSLLELVVGTEVEPGVRFEMDTGLVNIERALTEVGVVLLEVLVEERLVEEAETTIAGQEGMEEVLVWESGMVVEDCSEAGRSKESL